MDKFRIFAISLFYFLPTFLCGPFIFGFIINMQKCPEMPEGVKSRGKIKKLFPTMEALEQKHPEVGMGGCWKPEECSAQQRVAIIIPYRNRSEHLRGFLYHIHDFLQHQQAEYCIFVINQAYPRAKPWDKFNRAKLFNAGFLEVNKMNFAAFDCFIFHDVDLVPENERNLYRCNPSYPKRFVWSRELNNYRDPNKSTTLVCDANKKRHGHSNYSYYGPWFGGVGGFTGEQFRRLNGYSNHYWGWGAEDDDMQMRIQRGPNYKHFEIVSENDGKYADLELAIKPADATNPKYNYECAIYKLLGTTLDRMFTDGLNTVTQSYKMVDVEVHKLYTNISLDLMYLESINSTDYPCRHLL